MSRDRRPSIKDVAARAGVSVASVSRAMNPDVKGVSTETRARIRDVMDEIGYSPDRIGQALRARTTDSYALIVSNIHNSFYTAVAWELERALNADGKVLLMFNSDEDPVRQDACLREIASRRVTGIFVLCAVDTPLLAVTARSVPTVLINRRIPGEAELPWVGIDDYAAGREIMAAALRLAGRNVAIVHGRTTSHTSLSRLRGNLDVLQETTGGGPVAALEATLTMEGGYAAAERALSSCEGVDAIVCGNDPIAYGVHRRCREREINVPGDLLIFGFDDNPMNEWLAPWLGTVRVPHDAFAREATTLMACAVAGEVAPKPVLLPYTLRLPG